MERFSIGRTLGRTFELAGNGFRGAGLFLLLATLANTAISFVTQPLLLASMTTPANPSDPAAALGMFTSVWYWLMILFSMVLGALMYGGSIHGYLRVARGSEASLGECFAVGFAKLLPLLGLTLLWWIAIVFGLMLFLVPGAILITMWAAAMPALVGENLGVFESFSRSRALTRGSRWRVFAVLMVFVVVMYLLFAIVLGGLIGGAVLGGGFDPARLANSTAPLTLALTGLVGWVVAMLLSAAIAAIYVELVQVKEGGQGGELDAVFG